MDIFKQIGMTLTEENGVVFEKGDKEYTFWNLNNKQADAITAQFTQSLEAMISGNPNVIYERHTRNDLWLKANGYIRVITEE